MENVLGGTNCRTLATGLTGAATVIGFASWWTGAGAGVAFLTGLAATGVSAWCDSQEAQQATEYRTLD